jgi:glutamate synthase (NADPH/NADH) small chain
MGDRSGFLKAGRKEASYRPVCERILDYREVGIERGVDVSEEQASRCMDCGTPFCHWSCPVGNYIPDWNDAVFKDKWERAVMLLHACNNLPEITGRLCPAPCEYSCVLGINDEPVTIRENELDIIENAFKMGLIKPEPPLLRTGKKVAVIGSGPAGLSCAAQLNKAGHSVTVFERDNKVGGLLRYGIPDFKLDKSILDRRIDIYRKEGIKFVTSTHAGFDIDGRTLTSDYDALCLCGGAREPRDLKIDGRELKGIHFALDYLIQSNRRVAGEKIPDENLIDARDRKVVVIGGGDTGSDCVGTAHRQGAACVVQIEILSQPPLERTEDYPWPLFPMLLKVSTSHEEGGKRDWAVLTKKFLGKDGRVCQLSCARVDFSHHDKDGHPEMKEIKGTNFTIDADLVILALGFTGSVREGLIEGLGIKCDERGNVITGANFMTNREGVFCAGDMRRGQSLVVWAISEGRRTAHFIDLFLMGKTALPLI